jgi:hypothetical protein
MLGVNVVEVDKMVHVLEEGWILYQSRAERLRLYWIALTGDFDDVRETNTGSSEDSC